MTHRQILKDYLSRIILTNSNVVDWGSGSKPAWRYLNPNSKGNIWTTIDNANNIDPDRTSNHINWDITKPIKIDKFDVAFCLEVIEHVTDFNAVIKNIYNNLGYDGIFYLSAPFKYEIHADIDYWRFTENGLRYLLESNNFGVLDMKSTVDDLGYIAKAIRL